MRIRSSHKQPHGNVALLRMRRSRNVRQMRSGLCLAVALATCAVVAPADVAGAATLTVTSCADSGTGSLRTAVASASVGDTITFNAPSVLSPACTTPNTIAVASPITISTNNLTVQGPGATVLAISGGNATDIFENAATGVTVSGLTVQNGRSLGFVGGGITNTGSMTLTNSTVANNGAVADFGGGILNNGTLTVSNSTVANNIASIGGGIDTSGSLTLTNSTVSNNSSQDGGGGIQANGSLTVTNSTVSGNITGFDGNGGGGIENLGSATVTDSTVSNNQADTGGNGHSGGGGIKNLGSLTVANSTLASNIANCVNGGAILNSGSLTVTNSTLSNNTAPQNCGPTGGVGSGIYNDDANNALVMVGASILDNNDCNAGPSTGYTDLGYNISDVPTAPPCQSLGIVTPAALNRDPAGLANNGGHTQTVALLAGSAAIGRIPASSGLCSTPDQRGVTRPDPCDVGAYQTLAIRLIFPPNQIRFARGWPIPVVFQLTDGNGRPIPASIASTLGCSVEVTFNGGAPICATYIPVVSVFGAIIKTSRALTRGQSYPIAVTFTVGGSTVGTATTTVIAR